MAQRNLWHDRYGLGSQVTNISTTCNTAKGIALTNHPTMDPGVNIINQRKAIGVSYRRGDAGYEYQQATRLPTTTWEFDVSCDNIARILWSFFQKGAFMGAASVYPKYFVPYDDPECDVWLSLVRALAASGTADSHRIDGCIARTITLSANEGENLKASVEFIGEHLYESSGTYHNIASDTLTIDGTAPLLWQNATVTLGGNTINIPGFSITISNNAVAKQYDARDPLKFVLGDFTVEGTMQIPWATTTEGGNTAVDDFINGNTDRLNIRWGSNEIASSDNDFSILAHIRRTAATMVGDDEILTEIPFEGVSNTSMTSVNPSGSTMAIDNDGTPTGTSTTFSSSLSVGDLLSIHQATAAGDKTVRILTAIGGETTPTVYPEYSGTEGTLRYRAFSTPFTLSLGDSQNISGM